MFTAQNFGCFADGTFGHQHVRERLAELLTTMFRHHPRGGEGIYWSTAKNLVESLRGDMPDDAGDEIEAINMLNERCVSWECRFELEAGDLLLVPTEEYEEQFPDVRERI